MLKKILLFLLVVSGLPAAGGEGSSEGEVQLARDGHACYVICVPEDATAPVQEAARELKFWLDRMTEADFVLGTDSAEQTIYVGNSNAFRTAFPEKAARDWGYDGICLAASADGQDIFLTGGEPRGTLYAVATFLEDYCGIRWWTATETHVPHAPDLKVRRPDLDYMPPLEFRSSFYYGYITSEIPEQVRFRVRNKMNGHGEIVPPELGGHLRILGLAHTFEQMLPYQEYGTEHPEWFSLVDGKRIGGHREGQLCMTNPEVQKALLTKSLEWLANNPDCRIISISQNDNSNGCECPSCKALDTAEGSPAGTLLAFINPIAEAIGRQYPDVKVLTLAYLHTEEPPATLRPAPNVLIHLCPITTRRTCPYTAPANRKFMERLEGWSVIAPNLFIWNYHCQFSDYLCFVPNYFFLGEDLRLLVHHGAKGIFAQGNYQLPIGDFVELKGWVTAKMLWNPELDNRELVTEFVEGYYGAAAPWILKILERLSLDAENIDLSKRLHSKWNSLDCLNDLTEYFDQAQAMVALDPVLSVRVRRNRLALDMAWLRDWKRYRDEAERRKIKFRGPEDFVVACEKFKAEAARFGVFTFNELGASLEEVIALDE